MKPIIVIDDDADVREVMSYALENDGQKVISFENGKVALEHFVKNRDSVLPGMIIVDYLMPEMDGATFIQEIKKRFPESLGKIPMAITSAIGDLDPVIKETHQIIHLHKPMDLDDLLKVVREHCQ